PTPSVLYCSTCYRHLHSFPTRRSSDLLLEHIRSYFADQQKLGIVWQPGAGTKMAANVTREVLGTVLDYFVFGVTDRQTAHQIMRSEEHTSELQSRENLVCRLLLEKKKK